MKSLLVIGCLGFATIGAPLRGEPACRADQITLPLPGASQVRARDESWEAAARRYDEHQGASSEASPSYQRSAKSSAVTLGELETSSLPEWSISPSGAELREAFSRVRDFRFLTLSDRPGFLRRLSWLYPDDGCFARAEWMGLMLEKWGLPRPKKLFIFGDLSVKTPYSISGRVDWWYHVVPAILWKRSENPLENVVILDPAIEPRHPLPLMDWIRTMVRDPGSVRIAICDPTAYEPSSACLTPTEDSAIRANRDEKSFLREEWVRILNLGRDPRRELGEEPPWLGQEGRRCNFMMPIAPGLC